MSYGVETFVDGVRCVYTGSPFNLLSTVRVKNLKEGTFSLPIPSLGSGTLSAIQREYDLNFWSFKAAEDPSQTIWDLAGAAYSKGFELKSCAVVGGSLVITLTKVPLNAYTNGSTALTIDVFIARS